MRFWGSWSWLYFAGIILIVVSLIIDKVLDLLSSSANNKFKFIDLGFNGCLIYFITTGITYSVFSFLVFVINLDNYNEQKELYYSKYEVIVDFNKKYEKVMETNAPDVLEEALRINNKYFEFVDGEMVLDEFYFRYITDDSWKTLKPINTNVLKGE